MRQKNFVVYLALLGATLFWGISFVWTKQSLQLFSPVTVIFLRLSISTTILLIAGIFIRKIQRIARRDIKTLLLLALFEPFLYFLGENYGLTHVTPTVASVMVSIIPLLTPIAAFYFYKERLTPMNIIGIVMSVFGIILVIMRNNASLEASLKGLLFMLLAVVAAVGYSVVVKNITKRYNVYSIIAYQNLIGTFYFLPFFLFFDYSSFMQTPFTLPNYLPVIKLAVFASSFAFMLYTYAIKKIGMTKTNACTNIIPVFTAIISFFIYGEELQLINIIGIFIVISGLFLSQLRIRLIKFKHVNRVFQRNCHTKTLKKMKPEFTNCK